jgi:hypothetical protein
MTLDCVDKTDTRVLGGERVTHELRTPPLRTSRVALESWGLVELDDVVGSAPGASRVPRGREALADIPISLHEVSCQPCDELAHFL